jgi:hypothetical protein
MSTATRNRQIKKVLEQRYGRGNVRVTGSRGTGYGWVNVKITMPKDGRYYAERRDEVMAIICENNIEIGTYGYDDPGSDYGFGSKILISFDAPTKCDAYDWVVESDRDRLEGLD